MKNSVSFILGVAFGAAIGALASLLLAPQSGEELRARLQEEAAAERQRLQTRFEQSKEDIQRRVDQAYDDLRSPQEMGDESSGQAAATAD